MTPLNHTRQELSWYVAHDRCGRCGALRHEHLQTYRAGTAAESFGVCPTSTFQKSVAASLPTQPALPFEEYEQLRLPFTEKN